MKHNADCEVLAMSMRPTRFAFLILCSAWITLAVPVRMIAAPVQAVALTATPAPDISSALDQTKHTYDYKKGSGFAWVPDWVWSVMVNLGLVTEHLPGK
jgi:hypothetical protein